MTTLEEVMTSPSGQLPSRARCLRLIGLERLIPGVRRFRADGGLSL
jgi:hypothetical protein